MHAQRKIRIGIVFGGRSGEHEVSVASSRSIMEAIDKSKYEVIPIAITRQGQWLPGISPSRLAAPGDTALDIVRVDSLPTIAGFARLPQVNHVNGQESDLALDVIFSALHGTYGEDGSLQGLLEMAGIPYVGCGILGSALGMDKDKAKLIFQSINLPVVPWITVTRKELINAQDAIIAQIVERFGYPIFIKPANMGSSVGVSKAHDETELREALELAAKYDRRILVEQCIDARELECAVLGNDDPEASVVGEITPSNEFYDYQAKYLDGASQLYIPAHIDDALSFQIRHFAIEAFRALDLSGLARVDFFMDRQTNQVYINEVNTLPGFTSISMYPKLWEASGVPYPTLIDRLIELALERYRERNQNETNLLF
jgi:D-alanine-D-alanine ligase